MLDLTEEKLAKMIMGDETACVNAEKERIRILKNISENIQETEKKKTGLISKDALMRDIQNVKEKVQIVNACVNRSEGDRPGVQYCDYLCRIFDVVYKIVEQQEEVQ